MSGNDNHTYGFSKGDAEELVEMIGGWEEEHFIGRVRPTKSAGITLYVFQLNSTGFETGDTATAVIYETSNAGTGAFVGAATVYDPSTVARGLRNGEKGLCVLQGGSYIVVTARPPESLIVLTPPGGIPARSGSSLGSAACVAYSYSTGALGSTSLTVNVRNLSTTAIAGDIYIQANCESFSHIWVATTAI
jgi:hypothetical protein